MQETLIIIGVAAFVLTIWGLWRVFEKAGESGWKAVIPGYNLYKLSEISRNSGWWFLVFFLFIVPVVPFQIAPSKFSNQDIYYGDSIFDILEVIFNNGLGNDVMLEISYIISLISLVFFWVGIIKIMYDTADLFERGLFFSLGLVFFPFIFFPILGLGRAEYFKQKTKVKSENADAGKVNRFLTIGKYIFLTALVSLLSLNSTGVFYEDNFASMEITISLCVIFLSFFSVYFFQIRALINVRHKKQDYQRYSHSDKALYTMVAFVIICAVFFTYFSWVNSQQKSEKAWERSCYTNDEILCEQEYSDLVNEAKNKGNLRVCEEAKSYIKSAGVYAGNIQKEKIPKKQARKSCVSAVKQSNQKKEGFFTQSAPNDWNTYRNEKYKFSFRYPNNWQYHEGERGRDQHLICLYPGSYGGGCPGLVTINKNTDLESWYRKIKRPYEEANIQRSQVSIDGASGILIQKADSQNVASGEILLEAKDFVYNIRFFPEYESELKKLMSSFSFEQEKNRQKSTQEVSQQTKNNATNTKKSRNTFSSNLTDIVFTGKDYNRSLEPWDMYADQELGIQFGYPERYQMVSASSSQIVPFSTGLLGSMDTAEKRSRLLKVQQFKGDKSFESSGLISGRNQLTYRVFDYKFGSNEFSDNNRGYDGERIDLGMDSEIIEVDDERKQGNVPYYLGYVFGDLGCFSTSVYIPRSSKTGVLRIHECKEGGSAFAGFKGEVKRSLVKRYIEAKYLSTLELIQ